MSCCDNSPNMMPVNDALARMFDSVPSIEETITLPLEQSLDHILAVDVQSTIDVPGYDNSAMDGYALIANDLTDNSSLNLIGKSFAGAPFNGSVSTGQSVRIMTGAPVPPGADSVVMQENTEVDGNTITFLKQPKVGENIRRAGEDIPQGAIVLEKGRRLSPVDIGLLASIGTPEVTVFRPLKVGIFSTGDELRLPGSNLDEGCIYDSNRFVVRAILQRMGIEIFDLGIIPDQPEALKQAFVKAANECDAVISSGGVSVGEADYTKDILDELGEVSFWKVAMKPGKPFAFGQLASKDNDINSPAFFFGLPGNPVSATVTFHQLALPVLQKMAGLDTPTPLVLPLTSQTSLKKRPGRADYQRGILTQNEDGELAVTSTGGQGSGILTSLSKADCYIVLEQERGNCEAGETVQVQPFDRWLK